MSARSCPSRGPRLRILENSGEKRAIQTPLPGGGGGENEDPDGFAGDEQRGQTGRDLLLSPVQGAVSAKKKEGANDDAGADLRPGGPQALGQAPQEENNARSQVPEAGGVKRGNRFDSIANAEVRRAPDEIDGQKTKYDRSAIQLRPGAGGGFWKAFHNCR